MSLKITVYRKKFLALDFERSKGQIQSIQINLAFEVVKSVRNIVHSNLEPVYSINHEFFPPGSIDAL